jgi:hypothetical protein
MTYTIFMRATGIRSRSTLAQAIKQIEARAFFKRTADPSLWRIVESVKAEEPPYHE